MGFRRYISIGIFIEIYVRKLRCNLTYVYHKVDKSSTLTYFIMKIKVFTLKSADSL